MGREDEMVRKESTRIRNRVKVEMNIQCMVANGVEGTERCDVFRVLLSSVQFRGERLEPLGVMQCPLENLCMPTIPGRETTRIVLVHSSDVWKQIMGERRIVRCVVSGTRSPRNGKIICRNLTFCH